MESIILKSNDASNRGRIVALLIRETCSNCKLNSILTSSENWSRPSQSSPSKGVEGKFFVWKPEEIQKVLGGDGKRFADLYDVTDDGNFEDGYSILHETAKLSKVIEKDISWEEIKQLKEYIEVIEKEQETQIKLGISVLNIGEKTFLTIYKKY